MRLKSNAFSKLLILGLLAALLAAPAFCWQSSSSDHGSIVLNDPKIRSELNTVPSSTRAPLSTQPTASTLSPIAPTATRGLETKSYLTLNSPETPSTPVTPPQADPTSAYTPAPAALPPYLLSPNYGSSCIGYAPNALFTCESGIWTAQKSLVIGFGGDAPTLNVSGPIYIPGNLTILNSAIFTIYPPIVDYASSSADWRLERSLISVADCFDSFAPSVIFGSNNSAYLYKQSIPSPMTIGGIDSRCNSAKVSESWNVIYNDQQSVDTDYACLKAINQYRTFPSEKEPDRFQMRLRFQWNYPSGCGAPGSPRSPSPYSKGRLSTAMIAVIALASAAGVFGVGVIIFSVYRYRKGSSAVESTHSDHNYQSMNESTHHHHFGGNHHGGGFGGGGGGGGGFISSSAGSWS